MISNAGLEYIDEDGTQKLIPRCNEQNKYAYKYTIEDKQKKDSYCEDIGRKYPAMDRYMIEIMVDSFLNHPDKMIESMNNDVDFMKNIIS